MYIERETQKKRNATKIKKIQKHKKTTLTHSTHPPCETPFLKAIATMYTKHTSFGWRGVKETPGCGTNQKQNGRLG